VNNENENNDEDEKSEPEAPDARRQASVPPGGGGAIYGLGMIGAAVWFWQQADGAGEHAVGMLKALVWPAFLVYEAFKAFAR
jgi:hypothetical protein